MAVAALLPVLVGSAVLSAQLLDRQDQARMDAVLARNRTLISAVDAYLDGHLGRLRVLGGSPMLASGDLAAFKDYAARVRQLEPDWRNVIVADANGQQRMNLRFKVGDPLPHEDAQSLLQIRSVLAQGRGRVGDLGVGPHTGLPGIPLRLPVAVAGTPMVLMAIVEPRSLGAIVSEQHYPATWTLAVADSQGRIAARQPDRHVGERVADALMRQMSAATQGIYEGRTLEGVESRSAFVTSARSQWVVAAAIPLAEANAVRHQAGLLIGGGFALSLSCALALAVWLAGRVSRPVTRLAQRARDLAQDESGTFAATDRTSDVEEMHQLAEALETAAQTVRERQALMRREQALLRREQDVLRSADHAKDEFIAMMGHELRNPLSAIAASAHLLGKPGLEASSTLAAHAVIVRQVRHMTRLVEQLLDVSRLSLGELGLRREALDLAALVRLVVDTWKQAAPDRAARLRVSLASAWVRGDGGRLEQVIVNLLDNAEKFSGGRGDIAVTLLIDDAHAVLRVTDQGRGIAAADMERIFEPFVQGQQGVDRALGGLGLGLALVQRIVSLHDGTVHATSEAAGLGASFEVRLPRIAAEAPPEPAPDASTPPAAGPGRRVLVVEDNDDARLMLEALLRSAGHDVRAAADGAAALAEAPLFRPQFAIVDIGLPDMDGHAVARGLRAVLGDSVRLVALTGYGQPADRRRALDAGFDQHIVKPVSMEALQAALAADARTPGTTPD